MPHERIPISQFTYDPATGKFFRYGQEWKAKGVDAVVGKVEHEGKLIRASEWLRTQTKEEPQ